MIVKALDRFDHHGMKECNDIFEVSASIGNKLIAKGLVIEHEVTKIPVEDNPATDNQQVKAKGKSK